MSRYTHPSAAFVVAVVLAFQEIRSEFGLGHGPQDGRGRLTAPVMERNALFPSVLRFNARLDLPDAITLEGLLQAEFHLQPIQLIPSAKRLIKSLRDMGYDFSQAVADIVDNSVEAKATVVAIDVEFDGDNSWLRIADNGKGMRPEELREAMRYGAERDYEEDDLGKFGLGLKTASMSQCQCLSVASRWNPERADITAYSWDLKHIERTNRWEILTADKEFTPLRMPLKETTGTVVLWQRLDRILGYKLPYGEMSRKRLGQMCREIEIHLGMVFHKFLTGEMRKRRLKILVNGNEVRPWDPFCRDESKTKALQQVRFQVEEDGIKGEVIFDPFILPPQDDFSTPDAFRTASGPANWNQQQGFYIYRAGRMIQSGGWSNLRAPDEHTKLARIAVSFTPELDEAFKINVAKMRVQLPASIREDVKQAVTTVTKIARDVYDRKAPKSISSAPGPAPAPTSTATGANTTHASQGGSAGISAKARNEPTDPLLSIGEWSRRLLAVAHSDEKTVIEKVLSRLSAAN
jgi:hypothetical protein